MIDNWFIDKLDNLRKMEQALANCDELTEELYLRAKKYGYLDSTIERISGKKVASMHSKARLQDGRHLRCRVQGTDPVLLLHL